MLVVSVTVTSHVKIVKEVIDAIDMHLIAGTELVGEVKDSVDGMVKVGPNLVSVSISGVDLAGQKLVNRAIAISRTSMADSSDVPRSISDKARHSAI